MTQHRLALSILPVRLAVCRLDRDAPLPSWATSSPFFSLTRTTEELSVVAPEESVPRRVRAEAGWRALRVAGPLEFSLTGVLASLASPLAAAGIPVFALSTHDTDYLLVREEDLPAARATLRRAGHQVESVR